MDLRANRQGLVQMAWGDIGKVSLLQENCSYSHSTVPIKAPSKDGVGDGLTEIGHRVLGGLRMSAREDRDFQGLVVGRKHGEKVSQLTLP